MYCCNPFEKVGHKYISLGLRRAQEWMTVICKNISTSNRICHSCRLGLCRLQKENILHSEEEIVNEEIYSVEGLEQNESLPKDKAVVIQEIVVSKLNETLPYLEESPISSRKMLFKKYRSNKFQNVSTTIKKIVFPDLTPSTSHQCPESEIIAQLKEKFKTLTKNSEKMQLLTILPKSWSILKMVEEFHISNFMAREVKKLVDEKGILSTPNEKLGKSLPSETADTVKEFYECDDISRCMPGIKDFVSITENGIKVRKTKRLLLGNLREMYALFRERHGEHKIGLSKFCELRPKNVVLVNACGTHNVCVCIKHQNVKLMLHSINLKKLTKNLKDYEMESYKDCFKKIVCSSESPYCYIGKCKFCPGTDNLIDTLRQLFEENNIVEIKYKQWISTDRDKLETMIQPTDDFLDLLSEKLKKLLPHSFISKQQNAFLTYKKSYLKENEYVVVCDFSENVSFTIQDSVQGFHWNNAQATLYPIVIYYKSDGILKTTNFIIISSCLVHNTVAVHLFHKHLHIFLKNNFKKVPQKIIYFSDGCAGQFKNKKNFVNLCYHKADFGCDAEWHFFATSHGKGPSDGLGGTVKREVRKVSLQRPLDNQITTPQLLFDWCQTNLKNCNFIYLSEDDHREEDAFLRERFFGLRTIPGTQKYHCFIPEGENKLRVKIFSNDSEFLIENVRY